MSRSKKAVNQRRVTVARFGFEELNAPVDPVAANKRRLRAIHKITHSSMTGRTSFFTA